MLLCSANKLVPRGGPKDFTHESLVQAGFKPVKTSGAYLINAFLGAMDPYKDFADRYMANLKGTWLTADHTFRWGRQRPESLPVNFHFEDQLV